MAPILVSCILCVMLICSRNRKFKNKVEISPILAPIKFPNDVQDHEALNNLDTSNPAQLENSYPPKKPPDTLSTPQAYKPTETFKHSETSYPLEISNLPETITIPETSNHLDSTNPTETLNPPEASKTHDTSIPNENSNPPKTLNHLDTSNNSVTSIIP